MSQTKTQLIEGLNINTSAPADALVIDSSGKVGIGTASPSQLLEINGASTPSVQIKDTTNNVIARIGADDNVAKVGSRSNHPLQFQINDGEVARLDTSGRLLVGRNSNVIAESTIESSRATSNTFFLSSSNATTGNNVKIALAPANDIVGGYIICEAEEDFSTSLNRTAFLSFWNRQDGTLAERMRLASTGVGYVWNNNNSTAFIAASSVASSATVVLAVRRSASTITGGTDAYYIYANGSAGAASDVNLKKNIETTRDGYLEDLNRLRVVKYNWNDQEDTEPRELGLIAQEVEEVFPGLACDMKGENEDGEEITTKGIKYSVLPVMLLKALQEADAKIEAQAAQLASQAATIAALDARLTALEGA